MKRRNVLAALGGVPVAATLGNVARAQEAYPARLVKILVPFGPGGSTDIISRLIGKQLETMTGKPFVIENKPGATGMIGTTQVKNAPADGYTILLGSTSTLAANPSLYKQMTYDPTDFTTVAVIGTAGNFILVARNSLPANNLKEFAAYSKANGKTMQFGSSSLGSSSHLTCSQLTQAIGSTAAHVPYRGSGPALQDMIAGQIDYFCSLAPAAMPIVENKQIKLLAVLTKDRSPFAPTVPTAWEEGYKIDSYAWFAITAAKGTPAEIVTRLNKAVVDALDTEWVKDRYKKLSISAPTNDKRAPGYLGKFIEQEIASWAKIIKASGVVLN